MPNFDSASLPLAIAELFRLNQYAVTGPIQLHGAEIDLVAQSNTDPFAPQIFIEATVEHVDNDKYGKDVSKLAMIGALEPGARKLIVSARGFSLPVRERAKNSGIDTLTYNELFAKFERFEPYLSRMVEQDGPQALELRNLDAVYEEPSFHDSHGVESATSWLTTWYQAATSSHPWLIVVGEYGTGKTALTKIVLRRWLQAYRENPSLPIPFRIELRDFTKQFDADGLLQHFLRHHSLGHISLDFVWSLVRSGRIVLLLDGYDEMAQYLTSRERRVCLEALATLSAGGARGLLTSRPNYFSEAEEYHLFDVLYRNLEARSPFAVGDVTSIRDRESALDNYIEKQFLERYERTLRDLSPEQTEQLVRRGLASDPAGCTVVIEILRRVFRSADEGSSVSLSGKPVIISYLLDVVEQLKSLDDGPDQATLTEWDVYTLVVDQLMLRDLRQAGRVSAPRRRQFLHTLALWLTQRDHAVIDEQQFRDLIQREFKNDLRRYDSTQRQVEIENYYEDLRRSGTLTRSIDPARHGWRFSHNSLREFLLTEHLLDALRSGAPEATRVPISDAMRIFAGSQAENQLRQLAERLSTSWGSRQSQPGIGQALELLWDGLLRVYADETNPASSILSLLAGDASALDHASLANLKLSSLEIRSSLRDARFNNSELTNIGLCGAILDGSSFAESLLEGVDLSDSSLREANFRDCVLIDLNLSRADVTGADFRGIDADSSILVETSDSGLLAERLSARRATGYLKYHGGVTDSVDSYAVLRNHPNFPIIVKICAKFSESSPRQRLGIEQKGAAARDVPFARRFVNHLESCRFVEMKGGRTDVLFVTPAGRTAFARVVAEEELPTEIEAFLQSEI